jgi:hypothetical protein
MAEGIPGQKTDKDRNVKNGRRETGDGREEVRRET